MSISEQRLTAIILAAGSGSRMESDRTKQRMIISGESVLSRSVRAFNECDLVDSIVVVSRADEIEWASRETEKFSNVNTDYKNTTISAFKIMLLMMPIMMILVNCYLLILEYLVQLFLVHQHI